MLFQIMDWVRVMRQGRLAEIVFYAFVYRMIEIVNFTEMRGKELADVSSDSSTFRKMMDNLRKEGGRQVDENLGWSEASD